MTRNQMTLWLRFPAKAPSFEIQFTQLKEQFELLRLVGDVTHLGTWLGPNDLNLEGDDIPFDPEELGITDVGFDQDLAWQWLQAHGSQDLFDENLILALTTEGPQIVLLRDGYCGGQIRVNNADEAPLETWRELLIRMIELWGADTAAVAPLRSLWVQPRTNRVAGWITFTDQDWDWDPAVMTSTRLSDGWLLDPVPGREERAFAATRHMLEQTTEPLPPRVLTARDRYREYITGVHPLPDGRFPELMVCNLAFEGFVERNGKPIYLRSFHHPESDQFEKLMDRRFVETLRRRAEAEAATVAAVGTNGIIEWHTNHPLAAELLRDIVKHTGIQVHWTPMPPHQEPHP